MLATGTTDKYDELSRGVGSTLGGGALRLYTRSTPESDSEVAESESQSSHDKSRGERSVLEVERHVPLLHEPVSRSRITCNVEHRDSTQGQRLSRTQKPRNQRGRVHLTKVGEKWRCQGGESDSQRDREMRERVLDDFNPV
jgi:hypothetical protein